MTNEVPLNATLTNPSYMTEASHKEYTIQEFNPSTHQGDWASFVRSHHASTAFHSLAWKRTIENTFNYAPKYKLIYNNQNSELVGALPIFETAGILQQDLVNPFCEYGYPLMRPNATNVINILSKDIPNSKTTIIKEHERSGNDSYSQSGFAGIKTGVTFQLPTTRSFEYMKKNIFNRDLRTSIRDAIKSDLGLRQNSNIEDYYELYIKTMKRLGSPPFPKSFFNQLKEQFEDECTIWTVQCSGSTVAGLITLTSGNNRYTLSNVSDPNYWDKHPNEFAYSNMIKESCRGKWETVDFGRTEVDTSLYEFKQKFGGVTSPLISMVHPPNKVSRASISNYKRLEPIAKRLIPVITHPRIGSLIKRWIHE